jgi:CubicO group peptidase (beta-lactamase class C family)
MLHKFIAICMISAILCGMTVRNSALQQASSDSPEISSIVDKYRQEIPQRMQRDSIPGLAIAVVDDQSVLWIEGFGYTDWDKRIPVTPDTLFSIQSMSKSFTATAAMFAAQDGLVNLDAPITDYLPDFTVNSIFEEHPEQKITLRMLLSHTAGFAHEAPYGGNFDLPAYSFEKHIASISDTWLKFPVGRYYSYSNLGIDLAGYILQVQSGMPFIQYVQEKIFQPLGMNHSTLDINLIRADKTRAIGHLDSPFPPPVDFLIIPSGGVWTTAADMTRYLQFHINEGAIDGQRLLEQDMAETMYTPPNMAAQFSHYALGITVDKRNGARQFQHGGGGFGFNSSMVWYPELKLGCVVLTNSVPDESYAYELSEAVLDAIIADSPVEYGQRVKNSTIVEPAYPPINDSVPLTGNQLRGLISSKALPVDEAALSRRSSYAGKYIINASGFPEGEVEVSDNSGTLTETYQGDSAPMVEVKPGLFMVPSGDTFDFSSSQPRFLNIRVIKITTQAKVFHLILYITCGLLFFSMLVFWPIRALFRRIRRRKVDPTAPTHIQSSVWLAYLAGPMVLVSIFSLICVLIEVFIPNLMYFPWPHPFAEMNLWQHVLFDLPYISVGIAVISAILAVIANKKKALAPSLGIYFGATVLAGLVFNIVVLI